MVDSIVLQLSHTSPLLLYSPVFFYGVKEGNNLLIFSLPRWFFLPGYYVFVILDLLSKDVFSVLIGIVLPNPPRVGGKISY